MKALLLFGAIALSLHTFAQVPSYVPTTNLSAWYSFSGNTNDESVNNLHLTNSNSTPTNDRFSNVNSAYLMDGDTTSYMTISNPGNELLDAGTGDFSISVWFKVNNTHTNTLVHKRRMGGTSGLTNFEGYGFAVRQLSANNTLAFGIEDNNNNAIQLESGFPVNDGIWHHSVVVRNTSKDSIYMWIDGVLEESAKDTLISSASTSEDFYVGKWVNYDNATYNYTLEGDIDDIGIWKEAITACEIQDLYNAGLNSVVNTVTQTGTQLMADQSGAVYQWLDCDNGNSAIAMETNQSFTPSITGNYAVEVDMNGCIITSNCYLVDYTGIEELFSGEKELVKIVDLMGREVPFEKNKVLIYVYSDGTAERVFEFE